MRYLEYYKKWSEDGRLPNPGVCLTPLGSTKLFELIRPTFQDTCDLLDERKSFKYWGSDALYRQYYQFTPLRQNLVLLLAALNGEL